MTLLPIKSNVFSEATSNISKYMSATAHIQLQLDDSFAYQEYVMYSLKLLRILVSIYQLLHTYSYS